MPFKKISGSRGERYYDADSGVSYSWSFLSNANGSAFGRAPGHSGIFFRIEADGREIACERIGSARVLADARPIARAYLRDHGKAAADAVAEAAMLNRNL